MEEVKIRFLFREETPYGVFQDAIYFTQAEFAAIPRVELDALKLARKNAWLAIVSVSQPKATKEQLEEELAQKEIDLQELKDRIATYGEGE